MNTSLTSNEDLYDRLQTGVHVMGIVNVTPDSFSDGGMYIDPQNAVDHALQLVADGAGILDIGGESTRPGSDPVPADAEINRILPVIRGIREKTPVPISVDTTKAAVAEAAVQAGANIINDISGGTFDQRIFEVAATFNVPFVIMHMKGVPKTMQDSPAYSNVTLEIRQWLELQTNVARSHGVRKIIVDPGFGFGKTVEDNYRLLAELGKIVSLGYPVLVGTSRKTFLGKPFDSPPTDRLEGTLISNILAVDQGAKILRVHDVRSMRRAVDVYLKTKMYAAD